VGLDELVVSDSPELCFLLPVADRSLAHPDVVPIDELGAMPRRSEVQSSNLPSNETNTYTINVNI
jgi:hypothetical protein